MGSLLGRRLVFVTGKGGVGRSTVAAALGVAGARAGRRTIVCELTGQQRLGRTFGRRGAGGDGEATEVQDGLWLASVDPDRSLQEWLGRVLGSERLSRLLTEAQAFSYFAAAAPGAREIAMLAETVNLSGVGRAGRRGSYDLVIADAPASGHGLALLRTPRTFAGIVRAGPVHGQAERLSETLADPEHTAIVAVARAEEMAVNETLELEAALREDGAGLAAIVVNALAPTRFADGELEEAARAAAAAPAPGGQALAVARAEHVLATAQREQLERLRSSAQAPVLTLPFLFARDVRREEVSALARALEPALGADSVESAGES